MQDQMELLKKERIEALNAEFEDKKRRLMEERSARKSQLSSTPSNKPTRYQPLAPAQTTPDPSPGPFQPATSPDPTSAVVHSSGSSKKSQPRKKIEIFVPDEDSEEDSLRRDI